jgi:hypothetical protein
VDERRWQAAAAAKGQPRPRRPPRRLLRGALLLLALCVANPAVGGPQFRFDDWIAECDGSPRSPAADCSITVPFWQIQNGQKGSYALVVMLQTGNIGIVGEPAPVKATLRVDRNPPVECRQSGYCIFPTAQALAVVRQLETGSLLLIDVTAPRASFHFSLTPKGYQAGLAKIRAWGYPTALD